jgi:hypothetical protein
MSAPRLPNTTNVLNGGWKHDPQRRRPDTAEDHEPACDRPPEMRLITFEEAWSEILEMAPDGTLKRRDEGAIFECARHWMLIRNMVTNAILRNRQPEIDPKLSTSFRSWMAKIGLSPVDSHHVAAPVVQKGGDFD